MAKKKLYKYMTDNTSYKKLSKIYPYNTTIFANVYFHIMNHDYDADTLDDMLDDYDKKIHDTPEYDDQDIDDKIFDDERKIFNIDKFMEENDDEYDIDDEDDYLDSLYSEYANDVEEYFAEVLQCDMVFGYKFANGEEYESFDELAKESDKSKFKVVMVGIRFTNDIDEKVFERFGTVIVTDEKFLDSYNDIRKQNVDIINNAINESKDAISAIQGLTLQIVVKYVLERANYYIPTENNVYQMLLENGSNVYIEENAKGFFFNISRFKLSLDLNSYSLNSHMMNKLLDNVYGNIIKFSNAINLVSENSKKIEIFKYDNNTRSCIFIKNDSGGTYLFLDKWKSERKDI